ncbi:MAG TPA: beta-phosphoglucomutase family hydrolase [Verrucomicrobiae bacterium]
MLNFDAVIFDMDGVITRTASVHSQAWKSMFDGFLKVHSSRRGEPFHEFTHESDYLVYVDGRPRYQGVDRFLKSRNIQLPWGTANDSPGAETVCGLGNRKNEHFNALVEQHGVGIFESSLTLIRELRSQGIRIGLATSSKNSEFILGKAGILDFFETRVDGLVATELGLKGKPEPDIFTTACARLGCQPGRAIVMEDAVTGVEAGARGGFALVVGIARENNAHALKSHGAHIVVRDLAELDLPALIQWVAKYRRQSFPQPA